MTATENGQDFINGIISEGEHYGWENYGNSPEEHFTEEESDLIELARQANHAANELTRVNALFLEAAEKRGYDVEEF